MSESYPRVANLFGALSLAICERLAEAGAGDGPAVSDAAALVTLAHYPGQSVEELSEVVGLTHSGAVRLVDRLEAAGLVARAPSGRGRTLAVRLTPSGTRSATRVLARKQVALEQLLRSLGSDELAALASTTERLLAELTSDRRSAHRICRLCDEALCVRQGPCPVDRAVTD